MVFVNQFARCFPFFRQKFLITRHGYLKYCLINPSKNTNNKWQIEILFVNCKMFVNFGAYVF